MEENNNNQNPGKFDPRALVDDLKQATNALQKETQKLSSGISGIDGKLKESRELIDHSLKELKESVMDIRVGISPEDLKKLESYKDYFKHYKPVLYTSLFVMLSGWGLAIFGAYSGMKWYKESVRTKQEIRSEVFQEIGNDGNVIVEKAKWDGYVEQSQVLRAWQKSNPDDSESLETYYKGRFFLQNRKKGRFRKLVTKERVHFIRNLFYKREKYFFLLLSFRVEQGFPFPFLILAGCP